jgi:hypothetical protein
MAANQHPIVIEEVTDPQELAKARAQDERFERNLRWFTKHASEIYAVHRGKCVCVAGKELFVADAPQDAVALARVRHPEDDAFLMRIIPRERVARIYAHRPVNGIRAMLAPTLRASR